MGLRWQTCSPTGGAQNPVITSQNGSTSQLSGSLANSELLKTPPKRKTARKHTGQRMRKTSSASSLSSSSSPSSSFSAVEGDRKCELVDVNGASSPPPVKKRKIETHEGDKDGGMSSVAEGGEKEKGEGDEVKEKGDSEPVSPMDREQTGEEDGGEREGSSGEPGGEEVEEEEMEVGGGDRTEGGQKEEDTPVRGSGKKGNTTPTSDKKNKPIHPFFSEPSTAQVFFSFRIIF